MASSRRTGTNESISTYDSAGGTDYSTLAAWELDTDYDSGAGTEVLECMAGAHDDYISMAGASSTDIARIVRPYGERGTATWQGHNGQYAADGSCVEFHKLDANVFSVNEGSGNSSHIQDIVVTVPAPTSALKRGIYINGAPNRAVGCIIQGDNSGSYATWGIQTRGGSGAVNCLVMGCNINFFAYDSDSFFYNSTSVEGGIGYNQYSGTATRKNCISWNNSNATNGTWNSVSCADSGVTFADPDNDDYRLADTDTVARDQGTDLSSDSVYPFDDDILGNTRSGTWDIGFHEYVSAAVTGSASVSGGGVIAVAGETARTGAAAVTGAGALAVSGRKATAGQPAISGAGQVAATGASGRFGAAVVTGAGQIALAGATARAGSAAVTGGGDITVASVENASGAVAVTGGGVVSVSGMKQAAGTAAVAGGGMVTATGSKAAAGGAQVAGGGAIAIAGQAARIGSAILSGGGGAAMQHTTDRAVALVVLGGGEVLIIGHEGDAADLIGRIALGGTFERQLQMDGRHTRYSYMAGAFDREVRLCGEIP